MRLHSWLLPSLLCLTGFLLVVTLWLWKKNQSYRQQNRELILQNDSLQSVNIRLCKEIEKKNQWKATVQGKIDNRQ